MSLEQVKSLYENSYSIGRITQEYQDLAIKLKRIENEEVSNLSANNASSIAHFINLLIWDLAEKKV